MEDRTLIITRCGNLVENPIFSIAWILSVMLFPEDKDRRDEFFDSWVLCALEDSSIDRRAAFFKEYNDYAALLLEKRGAAAEFLYSTLHYRKAGGLSLLRRGALSGQVLMHLLNPSFGTLERAYDVIIQRLNQNQEWLHNTIKTPSKSLLRSVWGQYRYVSHMWGAERVLFFSKGVSLFPVSPFKENSEDLQSRLSLFLGVASFLRIGLIESVITSSSQPHILDPFNVWNIIDGNRQPIHPIKVSCENF